MALSDLQKMVAGMFYPAQPTANASIYDLARADAQRQSMSALGAGLIGAAVPQTPLMRAQALQNAFSNVGNTSANVFNAAQMRLAEQKYLDEKAMQNRMAAGLEGALGGTSQPVIAAQVPMPSVEPVSEFRQLPPAAARILQPAPPTAVSPQAPVAPEVATTAAVRPLTEAQRRKVEQTRDIEGVQAAFKELSQFQYENAQPYKPEGEFAKNLQDMQRMNLPPEQIEDYKGQYLYGKLEGLAAIDADPRIPPDTKKKMRDAEIRKLDAQGLDYLGVMEMQQPDGSYAYVQPSKSGGAPRILGPSPGPTEEYMAPVVQKQPDNTYAYVQPSKSGKPPIVIGPAPSPGEEEAQKQKAESNSKIMAFQPKATAAITRAENKAATVIDTAEKALEIIRRNPESITGITGSALQYKPGSDAYQLAKYFETLKANVAFNELQAMKQESPTGSALGQVAVQELEGLQATLGSLAIGQSADALESSLLNIVSSTDSLIDSARNSYISDYGADVIGNEKAYDLSRVYDIPDNAANFLRENADNAQARRDFDREFGKGAAKYIIGVQ